MLQKISIRHRILTSFILVSVVIAAMILVEINGARQENFLVEKITLIHKEFSLLLDIDSKLNTQMRLLDDIVYRQEKKDTGNIIKFSSLIKASFEKLEELQTRESVYIDRNDDIGAMKSSLIDELRNTYQQIIDTMIQALIFSNSKSTSDTMLFIREEIDNKLYTDFMGSLDRWKDHDQKEMINAQARFNDILNKHNLYSILMTIFSLLLVLILAYALIHTIDKRLKKLMDGTMQLGEGDLGTEIEIIGGDEFGRLSTAFNTTVKKLAETQHRLLEQSYYSGMAEMASGILHNTRNAFIPLLKNIEQSRHTLEEINCDRLTAAYQELMSGPDSSERKEDLVEYLGLSLENINQAVAKVNLTFDEINRQAHLVQKILSDHDTISFTQRPLEKTSLPSLISDAARLVSQKVMTNVDLTVADDLQTIGPIKTQRVVMVQVLNNLILNAAESIHRAARTQGIISINAEIEKIDAEDYVHILVTDNGEGIAVTNTERIFQRGYSSRSQGSGIGLHWCANSIAALNGKIYAESAGADKGATIHVLLPMA